MGKKEPSDKQKLRDFFRATLADSPRVAPVCRHFGDCGGCEFQDIPYAGQVAAKERALDFVAESVREKLLQTGSEDDARRAGILGEMFASSGRGTVGSPAPLGYRQRMDFVYAFDKAGLRRANRHRAVVDLEECPLLGERGFGAFQSALALAKRREDLPPYNFMRHVGELRYFVIRRGRSDHVLVSLVTKSSAVESSVAAVAEELLAGGAAQSVHWILAEGMGDVSFGEPLRHWGEPWIVETILGKRFRIGPNTFFQANPAVAELAYGRLARFASDCRGRILDLYSGTGIIAILLSSSGLSVEAVENVVDNIDLAKENIRDNNAINVSLVEADAVERLRELTERGDDPGLVVVNPPRPGVGDKGMASIRGLRPGRLAYLSCNPFTLFRDLSLVGEDYRLLELTVYDMFPQTRHFETLALLERR